MANNAVVLEFLALAVLDLWRWKRAATFLDAYEGCQSLEVEDDDAENQSMINKKEHGLNAVEEGKGLQRAVAGWSVEGFDVY